MKTVNYLLIVFGFGAQVLSTAQTKNLSNSTAQSSNQFQFWNKYADQLKLNKAEKQEFLNAHNNSTQHSHSAKLIPYNFNPQNTQASTCVNIDFESGNLSGWTSSSGFHPLFNPLTTNCDPPGFGQQLKGLNNG